jgi:hypothetical protein
LFERVTIDYQNIGMPWIAANVGHQDIDGFFRPLKHLCKVFACEQQCAGDAECQISGHRGSHDLRDAFRCITRR